MKKIELNNRGTILALSIAISVLLWSYVMGDINPQINRNFAGVAVNVIYSEDEELTVTSELDPRVDVRVTGRRNDVYEIRRSDMVFTLDLSDYGEGTHTVEIGHEVNVGTANVEIDYNPKEIEVEVERVISKTLPVELDIVGRFPGGITEERVVLRTKEIEVRGPRSSVDSVSRLKVSLNTSDLVGSDKLNLEIIPLDSNNDVVSNVELSQTMATVDVLKQDISLVKVEPNIVGAVSEGYEIVSVNAKPSTVELRGEVSLESIETEGIDVSGLSENRELEASLIIPDGVELIGNRNVTVDIKLRPIDGEEEDTDQESDNESDVEEVESATISYNTSELSISNLGSEFKIGNKDELVESLEVVIEGERSLIEEFKSSDMLLGIDFSNIVEVGSYQVEIMPITVKEGISIRSISPKNITIVVEKID